METRSYRHVLCYWPIDHAGDHFSNGCLDFNVRKNLNYERLLYRRFVRSLNNLNQRRQQVLTVFKGGADPGFSIVCHCCGATEGSEQQHNQDLKEIYKGRRILEFITFYHNALHLTTFFTTMHCI